MPLRLDHEVDRARSPVDAAGEVAIGARRRDRDQVVQRRARPGTPAAVDVAIVVAGRDHEQDFGVPGRRLLEGRPFLAAEAGQRQVDDARAVARGVLDQVGQAGHVRPRIAIRQQARDRRLGEHDARDHGAVVVGKERRAPRMDVERPPVQIPEVVARASMPLASRARRRLISGSR